MFSGLPPISMTDAAMPWANPGELTVGYPL
jgi:hypothetical protein